MRQRAEEAGLEFAIEVPPGLPLVKLLAELHGGRLELVSEVGAGTTAMVHFPSERVVER